MLGLPAAGQKRTAGPAAVKQGGEQGDLHGSTVAGLMHQAYA